MKSRHTIAIGLVGAGAIAGLAPAASAQTAFNTTLTGHYQTTGSVADLTVNGNRAYVAKWNGGFDIIDVSDPANPTFINNFTHPVDEFRTLDVQWTDANTLWMSSEQGIYGVAGIDVSNPLAPFVLSELGPPTFPEWVHNIFVQGTTLHLSGYSSGGGNVLVDVSVPSSPQFISRIETDIHDIDRVGDTMYIAGGFEGTYIYDVSTPATPVQQSFFTTNTADTLYYSHNSATLAGDYVVVTEEVQLPAGGRGFYDPGSMRVVDFSDPGNPVAIWRWKSEHGRFDANITVHNAYVIGETMYLSSYQDGVKIFDVSDPTDPVEVAFYDTFSQTPQGLFEGCFGVYPYQGDNLIFASDDPNGLFIFSYNGARRSEISGQVLDATTFDPIPGAIVRSLTADRSTTADGGGNYGIKTGSGTHSFEVSADGYDTITQGLALVDGGMLDHDFVLGGDVISVDDAAHAARVVLHHASPNPFNPTTSLRYDVPADMVGQDVELAIFDASGAHVRTLAQGIAEAGQGSVRWDGRNRGGEDMASGVYHARLTVGNEVRSEKLILTK